MIRTLALPISFLLTATAFAAQSPGPPTVKMVRIGAPTAMKGAVVQSRGAARDLRAIEGPVGPTGLTTGAPAEEEEAKPVDPQFLQLFQQAQLDRRPSTVLAEWSKPEPLGSADDPELQDPEEPTKIGDEPEAPEAPKEPTMPAGATEPVAPEDVVTEVSSLGDALALAAAKEEALASYASQKAAWDEAVRAHESAMVEYRAAKEAYDEEYAAHEPVKAAWDAEKKAYDKALAKWKSEKAKRKQARVKRDVDLFRRNVTLGRWDAVGETLDSLGKAMAKTQYAAMLGNISRSPQPVNGSLAPYQEQPHFEFDDIVALIRIAPGGFDTKKAKLIAPLVRRVFAQGHSVDDWLVRLREEIARPEEERVISKRLAALLLTAQGYNRELAEFLPSLETAVEKSDVEGLNLLARHFEAKHREKKDPAILASAWDATLAALAPEVVDDEDNKSTKAECLRRAVNLAGRVRDAQGEAWLRDTFTERPRRGMEVIATIGAEASTNMVKNSRNTEARKADLELLHGAIVALLEIAPERAEEWRETLTLAADIWLREAAHSFENSQQDSMGARSRRDAYGNIYWYEDSYSYDRYVTVQPVEPSDLLGVRPDGLWRETLPASLRPKIDQTIAELYLKVNEEVKAYPYIADLAGPNPKKAEELARTFLEVWLKKNDPNSSRNRVSIYNFSYGFNQRASGIPLTRSRQDRNLEDLTHWVGKLREIEGLELDSDLLMRCFTQCHSEAEVYRVEILEEVFGDLESLEPATLASMAQRMRRNLATIWRTPAAQKAAKTNRKKKDIEAEVQRGYEIAQALLGRAIVAHPDAWQLQVARGAMLHDLNNYRNELQKGSDFSGNRKAALGTLENAAKSYCSGIEELRTDEYTIDPLITWFNASLGASDIQAVTEKTLVARSEIAKIQTLLEGLPGEAGETHRSMFANTLFTRLSAVNPACKNRYLDAGFEIVGDHPQAEAARRVYDYYADLVTEIELMAEVDGSSNVGTEPFGLRVDLRYTKEIGREAGGFARYLQNQGNAVNYYYNYGRPQENYRDKFEEAVRAVLSEQFEVMSVTFNREDAAAKADDEFGWRRMSYCYLLLKARQPDVDRIPPLKIDLDFNDVTGYVVLPISSPVLPIDAGGEADARPIEGLQLTQILDERRAEEGILAMEVKAQGEGLVPDLDVITELAPRDFEVSKMEDQGVSVARFSDDEEGVVSERIWMVEFAPREGVENPETFAFAAPRDEATQVVYQRYDDADLMTAEAVVNLEQSYANPEGFHWWWLLLVPALAAIVWVLGRSLHSDDEDEGRAGPELPENLTPVNVLGLLTELRAGGRIDGPARERLDAAVLEIEQHYFGESSESSPDLAAIAREWVGSVGRNGA